QPHGKGEVPSILGRTRSLDNESFRSMPAFLAASARTFGFVLHLTTRPARFKAFRSVRVGWASLPILRYPVCAAVTGALISRKSVVKARCQGTYHSRFQKAPNEATLPSSTYASGHGYSSFRCYVRIPR